MDPTAVQQVRIDEARWLAAIRGTVDGAPSPPGDDLVPRRDDAGTDDQDTLG